MPPKPKSKPQSKPAASTSPGIIATISSFFTTPYDPHLHRQVNKPTNYIETLIHFLKSSVGAGILSMPKAYAQAGLVTGVLGTVLLALLITYCLHLLVSCQYALCKRKRVPMLTYPQSMKEALLIGPNCLRCMAGCAPVIVNIFLVVYQLGICCIYIVFVGRSFQTLFSFGSFFGVLIMGRTGKLLVPWPLYYYMLISMIPIILITCIPNLKILAIFSGIANVFTLIGLGVLLGHLAGTERKSKADLDLFGRPAEYPLFIGTILFGLVTVAVVIALENNMKNPKNFVKPAGVLNVSMFIVVALHIIVGVAGYLNCVDRCSDSIILDLNPMSIVYVVIQVLYVLAIIISYGLQCYVPVDVIWNTYVRPCLSKDSSKAKLCAIEYSIRIGICLLTFGIAVGVPRLGLFISLFGALCLSALGMCFPALMDICLSVAETGETGGGGLRRAKDVALFLFGMSALSFGTYSAMRAIIYSFIYSL